MSGLLSKIKTESATNNDSTPQTKYTKIKLNKPSTTLEDIKSYKDITNNTKVDDIT